MPSYRIHGPLAAILCAVCVAGDASLAFGAAGGPPAPPAAVYAPRLALALQTDQYPHRTQEGTVAVWVYFRDKGLARPALAAALQDAQAGLSERTALRRAKMAAPGTALADQRDLPLCPRYLAEVQEQGAVLRRQSRWLNAASFQVDPRVLPDLARLPFVAKLDLVAVGRRPDPILPVPVPVPDSPDLPAADADRAAKAAAWTLDYGTNLAALEQINVPPVHEMGVTGRGVVVGMLDTGFRTTHEALAGVPVLGAYDFVNDDPVVDNEAGDPVSANNHGTMTLSTVAGYRPGKLVAPAFAVQVLLAKTEDVSQEVPVEEDFWVAGLEWVEAQGADIISSSLGYIDWYTFDDLDGNTAVTTVAADLAAGRGLIVVNSAGNARASLGTLIAPADADSVITVGAVDPLGVFTYFSSPGPTADGRIKPDVMALGLGNTVASPIDDLNYLNVSGTSFSCPLTAGVAALLLSRLPALTPMQVLEALRTTADRSLAPDNDYGWGIVDAAAALAYFGPVYAHLPLLDTEDAAGPYPVTATVTGRLGVNPATIALVYRIDGGSWTTVNMANSGPDQYTAAVPGQDLGTVVDYYLQATANDGLSATWPPYAPQTPFTFAVVPLVQTAFDAGVGLAVPDGDLGGITSVISVPALQSGILADLSVDIDLTHPAAADLAVVLTSPAGTSVTLLVPGAAGGAGLVGTWPLTLAVSGPGALSQLRGEDNFGDWTLWVSDTVAGGAGVWNSWGLDFTVRDTVTSGGNIPGLKVTRLHPSVPNPFNPRTTIAFDLERPGRARLSIFDVRGMLVRQLLDESRGAGPHAVIWDGRDRNGRQVPSGTYLARLQTGAVTLESKMLLVR